MRKTKVLFKSLIVMLMLFISSTSFALTTKIFRNYIEYTADAIVTTTTNSVTDTFPLGPFQSVSFQCVWSAITGTQPEYKLQISNDDTNWDDVIGAVTVTTNAAGSDSWILDTLPAKRARVKISTNSTTGSLTCVSIAQGGN